MLTQIHSTIIPHANVVNALTKLRQEWQDAADDTSLIFVDASVGILLADLAVSIGLDSDEQTQVFGEKLSRELQEILTPAPSYNGRK